MRSGSVELLKYGSVLVRCDFSNHEAIVDLSWPFGRCVYSCDSSREESALTDPGSERELEKVAVGTRNGCLLDNALVLEAGRSNGCCGTLSRSLLPFTVGGRRGVLGSLPLWLENPSW